MDSERVALYELFRDSWNSLLEEIETLEFGHMNETDLQCRLYCHLLKNLKLTKRDNIFGLLHAEVDLKNGPVDLILIDPIHPKKTFAGIEIKYDPKPAGIKKDLSKLSELISLGLVEIGIFVTLATSTYKLKQLIREANFLKDFDLVIDGRTDCGIVEWARVIRPQKLMTKLQVVPSIDTMLITLGSNILSRESQ